MKKLVVILVMTLVGSNAFAQPKALARVESQDKLFGFINKKGEMTIPATFEKAGDFSDGFAAAYDGDKWGYINTKGEWVIQPQFEHVKSFDNGVAVVEKGKKWIYIGKSGEPLHIARGDKVYNFHDGVAFVRKGDLVGLMNTDGEIIIEPKYLKIAAFRNGYARFLTQSNKWGILDTKGTIVVKPKYDDIGDYSNQVAWTRTGEQMGLVSGDIYTKIDAEKIWNFVPSVDITYAEKNELIGFMNKKGEWVIPPTFKEAKHFCNGLAPVYNGKEWGYIDRTGNYVIEPQYESVECFSEDGLAAVEIRNDWGFIDTEGNLVIEANYEIPSSGGITGFVKSVMGIKTQKVFINGTAKVEYKNDYGFIDTQGNVLGGKWYRQVKSFVKIE